MNKYQQTGKITILQVKRTYQKGWNGARKKTTQPSKALIIKESEIPRLNWPPGRWLRIMETKGEDEESAFDSSEIEYVCYGGEHHLPLIMRLVDDELSEPYSIFTYRYFVYLWPQLSFLVFICSFYLFCGEAYGRSSFNWVVCMLCDCNF